MYVAKQNWIERGPGRPMVIAAPGLRAARRRGLGDVAQFNQYPGTYDDINCPGKCYVAGNVLDQWLFGNTCWPCHNVCAPGTVWDTSAQACSTQPIAPNPVQPVVLQAPIDTTLQHVASVVGGSLPWLVAGIVAVMVLPAVLGKGGRR